MKRFLTVADLPVPARRVLLRSDLNVPLRDGQVADDFRLRAALPAIGQLRDAGAAVILCSHLGRPRGCVVDGMRMAPVARTLSELGGFPVAHAADSVGESARRLVGEAGPGDVVLLENTRFHPGETTNDPDYASELAEWADFFVLDAFGSAHRAHASTTGVSALLRSAAGPLLERELDVFRHLMDSPPRPFTVVLGGAKISDKLPLIRALLPKVDTMLVGGGMCFSLLAVEGYEVGKSLVEPDRFDSLRELLSSPAADRLVLPSDIVTADRFEEGAAATAVGVSSIEESAWGLDIGPATAEQFAEVIGGSGSVFWNGPMGVFEWEAFRAGTATVATAMARSSAFRVAGGGDSVAALRMLGCQADLDHLSTGGGAGLELLEGRTLPGVRGLERWAR
ncbi:phosphoglycerate kinase [Candidatus Spongiisocius sp.]|uniref:phosphoglycerate kinase n=1 Tax=Candidatus Spongiisocius sp. TaxID=3101273 RepID=UPI003B5A1AE0